MLGELNPLGGGDRIPLLQEKLLIGRRPSCDIVLPFSNVSSHHCELEFRDGYWHARDLGSANGIKVNGERCPSKCLYPGDQLTIANHGFRIEYSVSADAPAPEEEDPLKLSLLEKAGLEAEKAASRTPGEPRQKVRQKQLRRASPEDDFLMEWFPDR